VDYKTTTKAECGKFKLCVFKDVIDILFECVHQVIVFPSGFLKKKINKYKSKFLVVSIKREGYIWLAKNKSMYLSLLNVSVVSHQFLFTLNINKKLI
jgi:hypothetical protein